MTPEQIALVQQSFKKIVPMKEAAGALFYARLFELDPSLEPMFDKKDLKEQGHDLMEMLATAVNGLSDLPSLLPVVRDLGVRHVDYKVEPEHYRTTGSALLWTLEKGLGEDFTPEVKQAWAAAYTLLSTIMIEAAARHVEQRDAAQEQARRSSAN